MITLDDLDVATQQAAIRLEWDLDNLASVVSLEHLTYSSRLRVLRDAHLESNYEIRKMQYRTYRVTSEGLMVCTVSPTSNGWVAGGSMSPRMFKTSEFDTRKDAIQRVIQDMYYWLK